MESKTQLYNKVKPFLAVILLQFGYAGLSIICKFALNKGMSQHVLVVYRSAIATVVIAPFAIVLDRSPSPRYCFFFFFFCFKSPRYCCLHCLNYFLQCYMLSEMKKLITLN